MKIVVTSMTVMQDEAVRATGLRAIASVRLGDLLSLSRVTIVEKDGALAIEPPRGRRGGERAVTWPRNGPLDTDLTEALLEAYAAMNG